MAEGRAPHTSRRRLAHGMAAFAAASMAARRCCGQPPPNRGRAAGSDSGKGDPYEILRYAAAFTAAVGPDRRA